MEAMHSGEPTVEEVLPFEDLPAGSLASRRAGGPLGRRDGGGVPSLVRRRSARVRGRFDRQDPGAAAVAALPPGPGLASVLAPSHVSPLGAARALWLGLRPAEHRRGTSATRCAAGGDVLAEALETAPQLLGVVALHAFEVARFAPLGRLD